MFYNIRNVKKFYKAVLWYIKNLFYTKNHIFSPLSNGIFGIKIGQKTTEILKKTLRKPETGEKKPPKFFSSFLYRSRREIALIYEKKLLISI